MATVNLLKLPGQEEENKSIGPKSSSPFVCHYYKKLGHFKRNCKILKWKQQDDKLEN